VAIVFATTQKRKFSALNNGDKEITIRCTHGGGSVTMNRNIVKQSPLFKRVLAKTPTMNFLFFPSRACNEEKLKIVTFLFFNSS
jgi:hypothetical protein